MPVMPVLLLLQAVLATGAPNAPPRPANAQNMTLYALRPLDLVDITDKDSADAAGDIFFWLKDHIIKPMHCRATQQRWSPCSEASTIDVNMVYQRFVVEYDRTAVGPYLRCNPDHADPTGKTWDCSCPAGTTCPSFGIENISTGSHLHGQFPGDPTPAMTRKFAPGVWVSTTHDTECGNPAASAALPCTWLQHRGKIVNASCVNRAVLAAPLAAAASSVAACEQAAARPCDFLNAVQTNLTDCCINALVAGVNATARQDMVKPFLAAFDGGCPEIPPVPEGMPVG